VIKAEGDLVKLGHVLHIELENNEHKKRAWVYSVGGIGIGQVASQSESSVVRVIDS